MALEHQPVRLERLAREVADEMQNRTEIHRLVVDFPREFPILDADSQRIKQVMRNILDNAIKYSPDGGLVVIRGEARIHDVVVGISDQGVGISPEDLVPLFDKYFRVTSPAQGLACRSPGPLWKPTGAASGPKAESARGPPFPFRFR
jgi:signal transduction histidine kinase